MAPMVLEGFAKWHSGRQYKYRLQKWGALGKNIKNSEMKVIVRKHQKRKLTEPRKSKLTFNVRGYEVKTEDISRWMKGHGLSDFALHADDIMAGKIWL